MVERPRGQAHLFGLLVKPAPSRSGDSPEPKWRHGYTGAAADRFLTTQLPKPKLPPWRERRPPNLPLERQLNSPPLKIPRCHAFEKRGHVYQRIGSIRMPCVAAFAWTSLPCRDRPGFGRDVPRPPPTCAREPNVLETINTPPRGQHESRNGAHGEVQRVVNTFAIVRRWGT